MAPAGLLRGVDRAAFAVALATRLRARGVPVGLTGIENFVRALAAAPVDSRSRLYWAARLSLVRRHGELAAFDEVFAAVFDHAVLPLDPHARRQGLAGGAAEEVSLAGVHGRPAQAEAGVGLPWATLPPVVAGAEDSESLLAVPERLPSAVAGLAEVDFEHLDADQMALLGRWLESAARTWPVRHSRRWDDDPHGHRIAVRTTLARSRRTGWEPVALARVRPATKPRRVVMLCDVSQSMQAQACAYLHLMRAVALTAEAEVFAFATTLTRLTAVLAHRSAQTAIAEASVKVGDRFGGTRIATNLQALLSSHHGGAVRGAVVVVGSDGWDSDPPELLASAMARLRRRAYRVIWMNPRAAAPGFQPRVATMAAALPYCDLLLPGDTFGALARVIAEISTCVSSTASRGSRAGSGPR